MKNLRGTLKVDEPLARYTSWHIGGPAKQYYRPRDLEDLSCFLKQLPGDGPLIWLGLGSNVLVRDAGVRGTVIHTLGRLDNLDMQGDSLIRAEAGVTCAKLAKFCVKHNFEGGVFFAGIPGTVGGALAMNAGAFGGETWPHIVAVEMMDRFGTITVRKPEEFEVAYREVKKPHDEWFVAGHFRFTKINDVDLKGSIRELLNKRSESQPIGERNCGSVFRNPKNDYAARLIESCHLKGKRIGGAFVSEKHANFIINDKNATAKDIEGLINLIEKTVEEKCCVKLVREVHIIGNKDEVHDG